MGFEDRFEGEYAYGDREKVPGYIYRFFNGVRQFVDAGHESREPYKLS